MIMTFVLFFGFGVVSYQIFAWKVGPTANFNWWFNGENITILSIGVGLFSQFIFGFIDNAGLFFGASFLDEWFMMLPAADDANVFAGYGNTYSDLIGALMGTFCGLVIEDLTEVNETPIWGDALGIFVGCLVGIIVPKLILGDTSEVHGLNKVTSNAAFLGDLDSEQLDALI